MEIESKAAPKQGQQRPHRVHSVDPTDRPVAGSAAVVARALRPRCLTQADGLQVGALAGNIAGSPAQPSSSSPLVPTVPGVKKISGMSADLRLQRIRNIRKLSVSQGDAAAAHADDGSAERESGQDAAKGPRPSPPQAPAVPMPLRRIRRGMHQKHSIQRTHSNPEGKASNED
jgi:hypothetical protein